MEKNIEVMASAHNFGKGISETPHRGVETGGVSAFDTTMLLIELVTS